MEGVLETYHKRINCHTVFNLLSDDREIAISQVLALNTKCCLLMYDQPFFLYLACIQAIQTHSYCYFNPRNSPYNAFSNSPHPLPYLPHPLVITHSSRPLVSNALRPLISNALRPLVVSTNAPRPLYQSVF